jgi:hypothetical protein
MHFGVVSMKHVEIEHLELFNAYAAKFVGVKNNSRSHSRSDNNNKVVQLANKCQNNAKCNFYLFWKQNSL